MTCGLDWSCMLDGARRNHRLVATGVSCFLLVSVSPTFAADVPCDLLGSSSFRQNGLTAIERRQYGVAAQEFEKALKACPKQRAVLLDLSQAHAHNRDFPQAI